MNITLDQLYKGKASQIRNRNYLATKDYVDPFIQRMSKITNDFRVKVKLPLQVTRIEDTLDLTYNRVLVQAVLPEEYSFDNHEQVIGLIYGLDTMRPIVKMYKGAINCACTNLSIFNPSALISQSLEPDSPINFTSLKELTEKLEDVQMWIKNLKNTFFETEESVISQNLGQWIINAMNMKYFNGLYNSTITLTTPIKAFKLLYVNEDSPYYTSPKEETCMFDVYNAFTQILRDESDIVNMPDKTLLIKQILNL